MAENLSGSYKFTIQNPDGSNLITAAKLLISESHTRSMQRKLNLAANLTGFQVLLPDFNTVSFIVLSTLDNPFAYRVGLIGNQLRTCRKFAIETPNKEVLAALFFNTGVANTVVDILVVGD